MQLRKGHSFEVSILMTSHTNHPYREIDEKVNLDSGFLRGARVMKATKKYNTGQKPVYLT